MIISPGLIAFQKSSRDSFAFHCRRLYDSRMFGIGFQELLLILAIILVLFGGKKIPELSRSIAESIKELRKGFTDDTHTKPDPPRDKTPQP